jgi:type IV pilus assembly protein PilC
VAVARFTRTLGTMIASGVPILDALDIVAKTAGNMIIEEALRKVRSAITEGKTIAGAARRVGRVPGHGHADDRGRRRDRRDGDDAREDRRLLRREVDAAVEALTALLEPFMMVFLGGTVGGMLIAMYLPIFKIADTIG